MANGENELGDAPVEERYKRQMIAVVQALDAVFNGAERPKKTGFILLVFPYNEHEGRCNYISNGADRRDVVALLKEQLARFEGSPDVTGRA